MRHIIKKLHTYILSAVMLFAMIFGVGITFAKFNDSFAEAEDQRTAYDDFMEWYGNKTNGRYNRCCTVRLNGGRYITLGEAIADFKTMTDYSYNPQSTFMQINASDYYITIGSDNHSFNSLIGICTECGFAKEGSFNSAYEFFMHWYEEKTDGRFDYCYSVTKNILDSDYEITEPAVQTTVEEALEAIKGYVGTEYYVDTYETLPDYVAENEVMFDKPDGNRIIEYIFALSDSKKHSFANSICSDCLYQCTHIQKIGDGNGKGKCLTCATTGIEPVDEAERLQFIKDDALAELAQACNSAVETNAEIYWKQYAVQNARWQNRIVNANSIANVASELSAIKEEIPTFVQAHAYQQETTTDEAIFAFIKQDASDGVEEECFKYVTQKYSLMFEEQVDSYWDTHASQLETWQGLFEDTQTIEDVLDVLDSVLSDVYTYVDNNAYDGKSNLEITQENAIAEIETACANATTEQNYWVQYVGIINVFKRTITNATTVEEVSSALSTIKAQIPEFVTANPYVQGLVEVYGVIAGEYRYSVGVNDYYLTVEKDDSGKIVFLKAVDDTEGESSEDITAYITEVDAIRNEDLVINSVVVTVRIERITYSYTFNFGTDHYADKIVAVSKEDGGEETAPISYAYNAKTQVDAKPPVCVDCQRPMSLAEKGNGYCVWVCNTVNCDGEEVVLDEHVGVLCACRFACIHQYNESAKNQYHYVCSKCGEINGKKFAELHNFEFTAISGGIRARCAGCEDGGCPYKNSANAFMLQIVVKDYDAGSPINVEPYTDEWYRYGFMAPTIEYYNTSGSQKLSEAPSHVGGYFVTITCYGLTSTPTLIAVHGAKEGPYATNYTQHWHYCDCGQRYDQLPCPREFDKEDHTFNEGVVTTAPTCTVRGVKTFTCTVCGYIKTEFIDPLDHNYVGEVTTEPTCEVDGVKTFTCTRCNDFYTEPVSAIGHDYDDGVVTKNATCEVDGVKTFTCQNDPSHTYTQPVSAIGHDYDDGVVTKNATCTEKGVKTFTCKNDPSHTYTQPISAIGHDYDSVVTIEPTCTIQGVRTYICKHDRTHTYNEPIEKLPHAYNAGTVLKEATCEEDGLKEYICLTCLETHREVIEKFSHNYDNGTITRYPSCEKDGKKVFSCKRCGSSYSEVLPKFNHDYGEGVVVKAPTCEEDGLRVFICKNDNSHTYSEVLDRFGHTSDNGVVTKQPTCTEQGEITASCTRCGKTYIDGIDCLGHDLNEGVVTKQPTCEVDGETTYVCARCHENIVESIKKIGHDFDEGVVTKAPTCLIDGVKTYTCKNDPSHTKEEAIEKIGHNYDEGVITKEPSCVVEGEKTYTCQNDSSHKYRVPVPTLGHLDGVLLNYKEATLTEEGFTGDIACPRCGAVYRSGSVIRKKVGSLINDNNNNGKDVCVQMESESGFPNGTVLDVNVFTSTSSINNLADSKKHTFLIDYNSVLKMGEQLGCVYEAKMIVNGVELQPSDIEDGMVITVKLLVPEVAAWNYRVLHVHGEDDVTELVLGDAPDIGVYVIDEDGYLVTKIDKMSEFAFINQDCYIHWVMVALGILELVVVIALMVLGVNRRWRFIPIGVFSVVIGILFGFFAGCEVCTIMIVQIALLTLALLAVSAIK